MFIGYQIDTGINEKSFFIFSIMLLTVCHSLYELQPLKKKTKNSFQDRLSLNAGQKYCRILQGEHSAILSTFIKLPLAVKTFVLSIFEWALKTGFTVW